MLTVLPGVEEVLANSFFLHNILMSDDFPTLLLPIKAYSGKMAFGHSFKPGTLILKTADFTSILQN
jgi:hypothetical protein